MLAHRLFAVCLAAFALLPNAALAQTWTLSAKATLAIGEGDVAVEYQFHQVGFVKRLGNGRILVTMGPDIRYYDPQGKYVAKAGGRGQGPGEFQYIQALYVLPGDTLLVLNFRNKVWLRADGKYVRSELIDEGPLNTNGWFAEGAFLLPNGNLLAQQYPQETPGDPRMKELHRPTLRYGLLDLASHKVIPLITSGGLRQMMVGEHNPVVQPFTPHAQEAIGADRVYVGDNDTTFISVFTLDGKPLGTVTVADHATPVTAKDLAAYHDRVVEQYGSKAQLKEQFEAGWSVVPKPKRLPYWGSAMVDRVGDLWVSDPSANAATAIGWTVFDRNGRRIARVTMPAGFAPREIGEDYVLGVARDEMGTESIRSYTLSRRGR